MKKITLLITILCAGQIYGMETDLYDYCLRAITSAAYSYIPSWFSQSPKESLQVQALQKDRNNFEYQLTLPTMIMLGLSGNIATPRGNIMSTNPLKPSHFLSYCYYQKFHNNKRDEDLQKLATLNNLLDSYKEKQIDGYSAIGAAILAPDVDIESKRNFIEQLIHLGFKLTEKDKMLAELALYNAIPENEKEKMILMLSNYEKDNMSPLLPEIKKNIVDCMIEQYKVTSWPLPDIASEK